MQPAPSAGELSGLLRTLLARMRENSTGSALALMSEAALTLPQIRTLHMLRSAGPHDLSSIADALNLSRPATSHLVERLVRMRLVERHEDEIDRRHKRIEITAAGAQLIDRVDRAQSGEFEEALGKLPAPLQAELAQTLSKVIAHLEHGLLK